MNRSADTPNTVGVISLGCSKNLVDTEHMLGILQAAGFTVVQKPEDAQILIVNTCGFIESAKQESINTALELAAYKQTGRCKTLVMTGCLSQRYRAELQEALPEVDLFLGVREYEKLPALLGRACPVNCGGLRTVTTPPYSAYLRIADGCSNRCAYCAIPLIRGDYRSVPEDALLNEARRLVDGGVTELTLIAQDTSGYGKDLYGEARLLPLLNNIANLPGLTWVRVLYTYPDTVNEALVRGMAENEKICSYLDIPLQHINDSMLRRMNRRGTKKEVCRVLDTVREIAPEFMLRTTMMVGFPGETEEQFQELMQFLRDYPFDRVGAFTFSPEDGTAAANMEGQIPEEVKAERLDLLMRQQKQISRARNTRRIGQETLMLITGSDRRETIGRTYAEAPEVDGCIRVPKSPLHRVGEYIPVRLTQALDYDMRGITL